MRRMRLCILLSATLLVLAAQASPASGATTAPTWKQKAPTHQPTARAYASMAYDAAHDETILFGGWAGAEVMGDTWTWDGQNWTVRHPANSPPPRSSASMAYDSTHGSIILFGGFRYGVLQGDSPGGGDDASFFRDTWRWNGSDWKKLKPTSRPSARVWGSLSDDPAINGLLLYGGYNSEHLLGDTWKWTGSNWKHLHPSMSPDPGPASLAYSSRLGQVVAFGGFDGDSYRDETWLFDGTDWIQADPTTVPAARWKQGMSALGKDAVIFGGYDGSLSLDDTWIFDGTDWVAGPAMGPGARSASGQMSYDPVRHKAVLFGGHIDEAHSFYGGTWTLG